MCDCPLSELELSIVRWLADGKDGEEIAVIIDRKRITVNRHISATKDKTGTHNLHGLVAFVLRKGWLE